MTLQDPQRVDCPSCGARTRVPLATLLRNQAVCSACGGSLHELGERTREQIKALSRFLIVAETLFMFEGEGEFETIDADLDGLRTPRDLIEYVGRRAAPRVIRGTDVLNALADRLKRPLDQSHLDELIGDLVPDAIRGAADAPPSRQGP